MPLRRCSASPDGRSGGTLIKAKKNNPEAWQQVLADMKLGLQPFCCPILSLTFVLRLLQCCNNELDKSISSSVVKRLE